MSDTENIRAELVIGARGWVHASWLESYYPDDLPEDWQLDYYTNEFGAVLLPAELWTQAGVDDIEQWLATVGENFLFFLELPAQPGDFVARLEAFAGRCAGATLDTGNADDWSALTGEIPLLYSEDTGVLRRYRPAGQAEAVLACLQAGPGEKIELPVLREQLESALSGVPVTSQLAFIIGNKDPAIENLQNAKLIAELLGA